MWEEGRDRKWEKGGGMSPSRAKGQIVTSCFLILFFRLLKKKKKSQLYPETNETTCNAYQNVIFLGVTAVGLRICPKWRAYDVVPSPDFPRYVLMGARGLLGSLYQNWGFRIISVILSLMSVPHQIEKTFGWGLWRGEGGREHVTLLTVVSLVPSTR